MLLHHLLPHVAISQHRAVALPHAHMLDDLALEALHLKGRERAASKPQPALYFDQFMRLHAALEFGFDFRQARRTDPLFQGIAHQHTFIDDRRAFETPIPRIRDGHWLFVYIHPYPDGNGRMARFLMNVLLASGGYPWTVVRVDDRAEYLHALDRASIDLDLHLFNSFIAKQMQASLKKA
jgi:hypothetical protein